MIFTFSFSHNRHPIQIWSPILSQSRRGHYVGRFGKLFQHQAAAACKAGERLRAPPQVSGRP